ncbi:unnamed protein product [Brassica oleracea]|uniref:(rape) hypothetical protein n=1 Tax=Brassica napus TaxID=3708 RepID=A0A816Q108_BRANA|nr:unnamed protein product [Brassica napus]
MTFFYFEFLPGFVVLMSETEVPVYCYWNGCIKYGTEGVYYEGSTPKKIIVNPKIALNRLVGEWVRGGLKMKQMLALETLDSWTTDIKTVVSVQLSHAPVRVGSFHVCTL